MTTFVGLALNGPLLELLAQRQSLLIGFECLQQSRHMIRLCHMMLFMMLFCMLSHHVPVWVVSLGCTSPVLLDCIATRRKQLIQDNKFRCWRQWLLQIRTASPLPAEQPQVSRAGAVDIAAWEGQGEQVDVGGGMSALGRRGGKEGGGGGMVGKGCKGARGRPGATATQGLRGFQKGCN